jgi:L-fucose isomerase-like protein
MSSTSARYVKGPVADHLKRPLATIQPILARQGKPTVDLERLGREVEGIARVLPMIEIQSPAHWKKVVSSLGNDVDAIFPVSVPAYPTEIWNSHPEPLAKRKIPVVFWPLMEYDEPDFWRWSARDMLRALGVSVTLVGSLAEGKALLRAYGTRRFLAGSKLVVFGEQNFPWNATSAGHLVTQSLGTKIDVLPLSAFRDRYDRYGDAELRTLWEERRGRFVQKDVHSEWMDKALRTYLSIRSILEERKAFGFGVNCYGDLIIKGGRDVPCLAQALLREDGYIASCDGDFLALESMAFASICLDEPCMMSNMYPVSYVGALRDHFGDPLSPDESKYPRARWKNLARLGHCGFVGVVPAEMTPDGKATLRDFGGTWEIKRDGRGCGIDADMRGDTPATAIELKFDGKTLVIAGLKVLETTHHGFSHCETTALLEFNDLEKLVQNISREHTVIVYGDHVRELVVMGEALGLTCVVC